MPGGFSTSDPGLRSAQTPAWVALYSRPVSEPPPIPRAPEKFDPADARRVALQLLFVYDAAGGPDRPTIDQMTRDLDESDNPHLRARAVDMAGGAWENRKQSDEAVARLAPQWPPHRQPGVDRNVLRLAVWELTHADTPPKVVIDQAIELAKAFSTADSGKFVNGVLDAVMREVGSAKSEVGS